MTAKRKTKPKRPARKTQAKKRAPKKPDDLFSTFSLAHELEVNRHTLRKWLHGEEPDAMEGTTKFWSLARVRGILKERSKALDGAETATQSKTQLECKRINLQAEKLEIEIKRQRKELTDTREFSGFLNEFIGKLDQMLQRKLEMEFPKLCAGLPLKDIRERGKQLRDAIRAEMDQVLSVYDTPEYEN
jgi:transposase-like protein